MLMCARREESRPPPHDVASRADTLPSTPRFVACTWSDGHHPRLCNDSVMQRHTHRQGVTPSRGAVCVRPPTAQQPADRPCTAIGLSTAPQPVRSEHRVVWRLTLQYREQLPGPQRVAPIGQAPRRHGTCQRPLRRVGVPTASSPPRRGERFPTPARGTRAPHPPSQRVRQGGPLVPRPASPTQAFQSAGRKRPKKTETPLPPPVRGSGRCVHEKNATGGNGASVAWAAREASRTCVRSR